jgi:hypothetical protein
VDEKEIGTLSIRLSCEAGFNPKGLVLLMKGFLDRSKGLEGFNGLLPFFLAKKNSATEIKVINRPERVRERQSR